MNNDSTDFFVLIENMEVNIDVYNLNSLTLFVGFPGGAGSKSAHLLMQETLRDAGLIRASLRAPGERRSNPLHYSCLGNPMDRGAEGLQFMGS